MHMARRCGDGGDCQFFHCSPPSVCISRSFWKRQVHTLLRRSRKHVDLICNSKSLLARLSALLLGSIILVAVKG